MSVVRPLTWQPAGVLQKSVSMWFEAMSPAIETEVVHALRRLVQIIPDQVINKWSLFAGTGLSSKVCHALSAVLINKYGIRIDFSDSLFCERDTHKQIFLKEQLEPEFLVSEVAQLISDSAANVSLDGRSEMLPPCFMLDAGFPCTSRTPLSSKSSSNKDCVQNESEATGLGFKHLRQTICKHWPRLLGLECVVQLASRSDAPGAISDAQWICQVLSKEGYWMHTDGLQSTEFGSPHPRERQYWGGLKDVEGSDAEITMFFNKVLLAFKTGCTWDILHFLTFSDEQRQLEADAVQIPLNANLGLRSSKTQREDVNWKAEHKQLYDANNLDWPPNLASMRREVDFSGLLPREVEAVFFVHAVFPPPKTDSVQFLDINPVLGRVLASHLDDTTSQPKVGSSPWRDRAPTLTGSLKLVVRFVMEGVVKVRAAEAFEYMRLCGWDDSCWNVEAMTALEEVSVDRVELLENMAGNAFSLWHYGPWMSALLITLGRFGKLNGAESESCPASSECECVGVDGFETPPHVCVDSSSDFE